MGVGLLACATAFDLLDTDGDHICRTLSGTEPPDQHSENDGDEQGERDRFVDHLEHLSECDEATADEEASAGRFEYGPEQERGGLDQVGLNSDRKNSQPGHPRDLRLVRFILAMGLKRFLEREVVPCDASRECRADRSIALARLS